MVRDRSAARGPLVAINSVETSTTIPCHCGNFAEARGSRQQTLNRIPIGRMGTATDIAKGIVFLASDDSGYMTGAGLVVDGGITAQ
jgi:NAD(P)-dependent dehydrogenase (short-subunit alcohol dehydrogenase family)